MLEAVRQTPLSSYRPITSPKVQCIQSNIHLVFSISSIWLTITKHVSNFGKVSWKEMSLGRLSGIPCHLVFLGHLLACFLGKLHLLLVTI